LAAPFTHSEYAENGVLFLLSPLLAARAAGHKITPLLPVGAESGVGAMLLDTKRLVAADVRGRVFAGSGHYMLEEASAPSPSKSSGSWVNERGRKPHRERE
jgi:hypothetical protein